MSQKSAHHLLSVGDLGLQVPGHWTVNIEHHFHPKQRPNPKPEVLVVPFDTLSQSKVVAVLRSQPYFEGVKLVGCIRNGDVELGMGSLFSMAGLDALASPTDIAQVVEALFAPKTKPIPKAPIQEAVLVSEDQQALAVELAELKVIHAQLQEKQRLDAGQFDAERSQLEQQVRTLEQSLQTQAEVIERLEAQVSERIQVLTEHRSQEGSAQKEQQLQIEKLKRAVGLLEQQRQQHIAELEKRRAQEAHRVQEIEAFQTERRELEAKTSALESDLESLHREKAAFEAQAVLVLGLHAEMEELNQRLVQNSQDFETQRNQLETAHGEFQSRLQEIESEHAQLLQEQQTQTAQLEGELLELKTQNSSNLAQIERHASDLAVQKEAIQLLEKEKGIAVAQREGVERKLAELEADIEQRQQVHQEVLSQVEAQRAAHTQLEVMLEEQRLKHDERVQAFETELDKAHEASEAQQAALNAEIDSLKKSLTEHRSEMDDIQQRHQAELEGLNQQVADQVTALEAGAERERLLTERHEALLTEQATDRAQLKSTVQSLAEATAEVTSLQSRAVAQQQQLDEALAQLAEARAEQSEQAQANSELEAQIEQIVGEHIQTVEALNAELQRNQQAHETAISALNTALLQEKDALESQKSQFAAERAALSAQNEGLHRAIDERSAQFKTIQESLTATIDEQANILDELQVLNASLGSERSALKTENRLLTVKHTALESEKADLEHITQELQHSIRQTQAELAAVQAELEQAKQKLDRTLDAEASAQEQLIEVEKQAAQLQERVAGLEQVKSQLNAEKLELQQAVDAYEQKIQLTQASTSDQSVILDGLQSKIQGLEAKLLSQSTDLEAAYNALAERTEHLAQLEQAVQEASQRQRTAVEAHHQEIVALEQSCEQLRVQLATATTVNTESTEKYEKREQELLQTIQAHVQEIEALERNIAEQQSAIGQTSENNVEHEHRMAELKEELSTAQAQVLQQQAANDKLLRATALLKQKNTQLTTELAAAVSTQEIADAGSVASVEALASLEAENAALKAQYAQIEGELEAAKVASGLHAQWQQQRVELLRELDALRRDNIQVQQNSASNPSAAPNEASGEALDLEWLQSYRSVVNRSNRKWDVLEQLINKASGRMLSISERAPKMKNQMEQLLRVMQQIQQGGRQIIATHDDFSKNILNEDES